MTGIYWIPESGESKLAIVDRPQGDGELERDLADLKNSGINGLVSLLTAPEEKLLGLEQESALAAKLGLSFFSFPIPDRHVPGDAARFSEFTGMIAERIKSGESIGIHCRASIGRSTIAAAAVLVHLGWKADAALDEIESARRYPVPDSPEQRTWILALTPRDKS